MITRFDAADFRARRRTPAQEAREAKAWAFLWGFLVALVLCAVLGVPR